MNSFNMSCCLLTGPLGATLVESLHALLLYDWVKHPTLELIHPHCSWKLADRHPHAGVYQGNDFYANYVHHLAQTYSSWHELIDDVIGSVIGGIVVGHYYFQQKPNGPSYKAAFTHFYRIKDEQILSAQFYMGDAKARKILPCTLVNEDFFTNSLSLN